MSNRKRVQVRQAIDDTFENVLDIVLSQFNILLVTFQHIFQSHGKVFEDQVSFPTFDKVVVIPYHVLVRNFPEEVVLYRILVDFLDDYVSIGQNIFGLKNLP